MTEWNLKYKVDSIFKVVEIEHFAGVKFYLKENTIFCEDFHSKPIFVNNVRTQFENEDERIKIV